MNKALIAMVVGSLQLTVFTTAAQAGDWSFNVTPRISATFSSGTSTTLGTGTMNTSDQSFLVGGLSFGVANTSWGGADILATVLYGEGGGDFTIVANDNGTFRSASGDSDDTLLDLELLYRRPIGSSGLYWSVGSQYRQLNYDLRIRNGLPLFNGSNESELEVRSLIAKTGIGTAFPIQGSDKQRLFGNVLVGAGATEARSDFGDDSGGVIAVDVNMGWQYFVGDASSVALRYRAQLVRLFSQDILSEDWQVFHGPELNYTYRF